MIEVDGAGRLARTLEQAADELDDLTSTNLQAAGAIARAVRPPVLTGALAASITPTATRTEAVIGSGLVYAPVQEYGSAGHNIRARRYMRAAFDAQQAATVTRYTTAVAAAVAGVKGA